MVSTVHSIQANLVRQRAKNINSVKINDNEIDEITTRWEYRTYSKLAKNPSSPITEGNEGKHVLETVKSAIIDGAASEIMAQFANLQNAADKAYQRWKDATDEIMNSDPEEVIVNARFDHMDGVNEDLYMQY